MNGLTGAGVVAGVVGRPVRHSLSPLLHQTWIVAAGLDAAYVPFPVAEDGFGRFVEGMRGGAVRGVNVTLPFKSQALACADLADPLAEAAGAANLLLFHLDGVVEARNTDGAGLLAAFADQATSWRAQASPTVVLGAGGAARGAVAALLAAGAPSVRVVNRSLVRAQQLAAALPEVEAFAWADLAAALDGVGAVINATSVGLEGEGSLDLPWEALPRHAVVMDMVYRPLRTDLLRRAKERGFATVDGLAMLIGQARPSFEALFGQPPPWVDVRSSALRVLGEKP